MNHSFFADRLARRTARLQQFSQLREVLQKQAGGWDMRDRMTRGERPRTTAQFVQKAIETTRDLLDTFDFPVQPRLQYTGVKTFRRASDELNAPVEDGIIMLTASFVTQSGVKNEVGIPVLVRDGMIVQPSVMFHEGTMKVIAPSSVNQIIATGTFDQPLPSRGQFSGPLSRQEQTNWFEQSTNPHMDRSRFAPGMFGKLSTRELLRAAVRGDRDFSRVAQQQAQACQYCQSDNVRPYAPQGEDPQGYVCNDCGKMTWTTPEVQAQQLPEKETCLTCAKELPPNWPTNFCGPNCERSYNPMGPGVPRQAMEQEAAPPCPYCGSDSTSLLGELSPHAPNPTQHWKCNVCQQTFSKPKRQAQNMEQEAAPKGWTKDPSGKWTKGGPSKPHTQVGPSFAPQQKVPSTPVQKAPMLPHAKDVQSPSEIVPTKTHKEVGPSFAPQQKGPGVEILDEPSTYGQDIMRWHNMNRQMPRGSHRGQLGVQPGSGDIRLKSSPAKTVGDRVEATITFDPDQTAQMSDGNLRQAIRSFVLRLGTEKSWRDWGTIADVQIDDIDRQRGEAT